MTELKCCPLCRGEAELLGANDMRWIQCSECGTEGPKFDNLEEAVEHWNRRASPWRSCKNDPPEIGQRVLIAEKHDCRAEPYNLRFARYDKHGYKSDWYYIDAAWWMAVPEPPELLKEEDESRITCGNAILADAGEEEIVS
jgi:hypothetical protein